STEEVDMNPCSGKVGARYLFGSLRRRFDGVKPFSAPILAACGEALPTASPQAAVQSSRPVLSADSSALARSKSLTAGANHLHLITEGTRAPHVRRSPCRSSHLPAMSANP